MSSISMTSKSATPTLSGASTSAIAIACLIALALGVRLQMFWITGGEYESYQTWAEALYYWGITTWYLIGADLIATGQPYNIVAYPPGYSIVLAILGIAADGDQSLRLYQAALDSLAILPLYYIGIRLTGSRIVGLLAGSVHAVSPLFAFNSVTLLAESLSPLLVASVLALMLWARDGGPLRWAILGFVTAFAALVRPDLVLFCIPLGAWWLFTSRRAVPLAALAIAFAVPLLSWGFYSKAVTGQFIITSNSGMYAFWAGLGQVPNDYGYFVNDMRAGEMLTELGIVWHSPEANEFWKKEYFDAWQEHPEHVLATIWHRFSTMPFMVRSYLGPDEYGSWTHDYFEHAGIFIVALSCILLIRRKRYATAFIVTLPLLYALGSLGPVYYEPRYVRYIALSYILAPLAAICLLQVRWLRMGTLGIVGVGLAADMLAGAPALLRQAEAARLEVAAAEGRGSVVADITTLEWTAMAPDVAFEATDDGLVLTTSAQAAAYQITARDPLPAGMVTVRYAIEATEGTIAIGILPPDGSRWLAVRTAGSTSPSSGTLSAALPDGGILLITNARSEDLPSRVTIRSLDVITFP
jgi:hypothetical protein